MRNLYPRHFQLSTLLLLFFLPYLVQAEGTKQLAPNASDRVYLYTNVAAYGNFAQYDGTDVQRLYIHISDPDTEQIFLGFSQPSNSGHYPCEGSQMPAYFRIVGPNGTIVYPERGNPKGSLLYGNTINITDKSQAVNGPNQIVGTGGYEAIVFDPIGYNAGDYYIEFSRNESTPSLNDFLAIEWWDITVATKEAAPKAINGRVYAKNWSLMTPSISCGEDAEFGWFDQPFNGSFHVYTEEKIVAKVDFDAGGFQAAAFNVFFNDFGTKSTGDVITDRRSLSEERTTAAQHRIFLNDPDMAVYPSGELGTYSLEPRYMACENGTGCVQTAITAPGQIDILIDFDTRNGPDVYDKETADVLLAYKVEPEPGEQPPYIRCIPWDGKDGFGRTVQEKDRVDLLIRYTQGIYHFPIYDAEFFKVGFKPTTVRPLLSTNAEVSVYYDDTTIPVSAGSGEPSEESFNGCDAPCHSWTNKSFGNLNTINTWFFAREEIRTDLELEICPIAATDDLVSTSINLPITIPVLANDKEIATINPDILTVGAIVPEHGTTVFDPTTGAANYTPDAAYIGKDSFEYVICFDVIPVYALCDTALVVVDVQPIKENCTNAIDDDGDGLPDCDDPDCLPQQPSGVFRRNGQ